MNFNNYEFYACNDTSAYHAKKKELQTKSYFYSLFLKNSDGKILDSLELSVEDYINSGVKYASYIAIKHTNSQVIKELNKLETEFALKVKEFNKSAKDIFLADLAKEFSITQASIEILLQVILNRFQLLTSLIQIDSEEDNDIYNSITYESFFSETLYSEKAEKIFKLIQNEILLLRLDI